MHAMVAYSTFELLGAIAMFACSTPGKPPASCFHVEPPSVDLKIPPSFDCALPPNAPFSEKPCCCCHSAA